MKIGVSSYCFSRLIKRGEMTLFDAIDFAAQTGFDCMEFSGLTPPEGTTDKEYARQLAEHCKSKGLEITNFCVFADFLYSCDGDMDKEVERLKGYVDICKIFGAKKMRHDSTWGFKEPAPGRRNYMDAIKLIAPGIRKVTEYAEQQGIRTMCENHGLFMQDAARMEQLVLGVDHPNFGLLVDIGNFACADEKCENAVSLTAPYAFHVHAKDFLFKPGTQPKPDEGWFSTRSGNHLRGTIIGHGFVPVEQCINIIKKSGYDDCISLEFEGLEEPREAIRMGCETLKRLCK